MDEKRLRAMLGAGVLELKQEGPSYLADNERPLTIYATRGGELVRFGKVSTVTLEPALLEAGLVVLEREKATTVVVLDAIFAVEREPVGSSKDKRRTGFA